MLFQTKSNPRLFCLQGRVNYRDSLDAKHSLPHPWSWQHLPSTFSLSTYSGRADNVQEILVQIISQQRFLTTLNGFSSTWNCREASLLPSPKANLFCCRTPQITQSTTLFHHLMSHLYIPRSFCPPPNCLAKHH